MRTSWALSILDLECRSIAIMRWLHRMQERHVQTFVLRIETIR